MKEIQQEITPITNEDLFIILNHPNAHFDYPIHCHPEYEITNLNGYYDSLRDLLRHMIEKDLSTEERQQEIYFAENLEQIKEILLKE